MSIPSPTTPTLSAAPSLAVAQQTAPPAPAPAAAARTVPPEATGYCVAGGAALVVGLFILGIPCGVLATQLGQQAAKRGAPGFGAFLRWGGWVEIAFTVIGIMASIQH